jgi:protocatechuate 3,4-dioxygenase beta subunit
MQPLKTDVSRRLPRKWWLWGALVAAAAVMVWMFLPNSQKVSHTEQDAESRPKPTYRDRSRWPAPERSNAEAPATPPIRGTVYDIDGAPVAGAGVFATTFKDTGNAASEEGSTLSDKQGRFELHVPHGMYFLRGEKDGYGPAAVIAQNGDDIAVVLPKSGVVHGHVYDERGRPVRQFTIDVVSPAPDDLAAPPPLWSKRFDSPDGSFRVDQLPIWGGFLRASAPNYAPAFSPPVQVKPGDTAQMDLTLSPGCAMVGRVVDENGKPLPDVLVNAESRLSAGMMSNTSLLAGGEAQSDAEGLFRLQHVSAGPIIVRGYDGTHAVSTVMVEVSECDKLEPVTLTMSAGGSITGVVRRSDGTPFPGARLTVSHKSIGFVNAISDAAGHYRFDQLPPVMVRLDVQDKERHLTTNLTVLDGEIVERDLTLFGEGAGELRGRITAGGMPLAGAQLLVVTNRGTGMDVFNPRTEKDGTYRVPALPDGGYLVLVSSTNRAAGAYVRAGSVETVDLDVAVAPQTLPIPEHLLEDEPQ